MYRKSMVVCLTGGIASGKTAVSDQWQSRQITVIDTDVIAREVVSPGTLGLSQVVQCFGYEMVGVDGGLDRGKLRSLVFSDPKQLKALNAIVHPLIKDSVEQKLDELGDQLAVVVIPLYKPEINYSFIDRVCVVDCQESTQLNRLKNRDGIDQQLALDMIESQPSRRDRLHWADDVIVNESDLVALRSLADEMLAVYLTNQHRLKKAEGT